MIYYIQQKQRRASEHFGFWDKGLNPNAPEISVHPNSTHKKYVGKEFDGHTWRTGLNENAPDILGISNDKERKEKQAQIRKIREELERATGFNLSAIPQENEEKDFWFTTAFELVGRHQSEKRLDMNKPMDKILYYAGLANGWFAENYEKSYEDSNIYLYLHNPEIQTSRKQLLQEITDEVAATIVLSKNNTDKLFYWCHARNLTVNRAMNKEVLYNLLSAHRKTLKSVEDFESLKSVLDSSNEELIVGYITDWAIRNKKILASGGSYRFGEMELGSSKMEVKQNLLLLENAAILKELQDMEARAQKR